MIKRLLKICGLFLTFFSGLAALYLGNLFFMKPVSIDHYLAKEMIIDLFDSPEYLTYRGDFDQYNWITKHNSKLSIQKPEDLEESIADYEENLKILNNYKSSSLIR